MLVTQETHPEMYKQLISIFGQEKESNPVFLAKRFDYKDSVNLFVGSSDHVDISLLK